MSNEKKDVALFFISKIIIGIIGLLLVTFYSSLIDPSEYGDYSLISGFVSALISIFIGWIGSSSLRYYIDYENDKKTFFSNILMYLLIMLLIVCSIIIAISYCSKTIPIKNYIFPTIIYSINYAFFEVFEKIFRATRKTKIYTIAIIIQAVINISLFYIFAKCFSLGARSIFFSDSISRLFFIIVGFICLHVIFNLKIYKPNIPMLKKFLSYGIPMIGVWGVSWLLSYCDRYIIALFYDSYQVGIYDMSYKISESSINVIITSFTLSIFPMLINTWKKQGKRDVERKLTEVIKYYFMLIIPAVFGMILISSKLYLGILDSKYESGRMIIVFVCIGMLFSGLNSILNKIWQLNEKTKNIFYIMLVSVIINIILNLVFIPIYGVIVSAITTLISYLCSTIITYILVKKEVKITIDFKSLIKTLIASGIMVIFLLLFNRIVDNLYMLLIEVAIAATIYLLISVILKNITIKFRYDKLNS